MANGRFQFCSDCLRRMVEFHLVLPNDLPKEWTAENPHFKRPMKTLFLLHGYTGGSMDWMTGSAVCELAGNYNLAVVCPAGENSFYLDGPETGRQYATYVGEELVQYVRKTFGLAQKMEDTYIGGLSMGGFGAIHTALQFNHHFAKAFALSSALIVHEVANMKPGQGNPVANYEYYRLMFGEPEKLLTSINNPEELIRRHQAAGERIPALFMACGTEDFLLENNRELRDFLQEKGVEHVYHESPGIHNWAFWNQYLEPAIQWMLEA